MLEPKNYNYNYPTEIKPLKRYTAYFWRHNEQLKNKGYTCTREIKAADIRQAEKMAREIRVPFGSMTLLKIEQAEA